jgi:hypothetical protein
MGGRDGRRSSGDVMSFLKSLFGRRAAAAPEAQATLEYEGFTIRAVPYQSEGQYQTAGEIEKEIDGVKRQHKFIRAERHGSLEEATSFSLMKARQIIDQQGERIFAERPSGA